MRPALLVIVSVVTLDAVGIGLIFPVLPALLKELTGSPNVATTYGLIIASYAAMQFLFSPILGSLSDRYGRRPVLIVSLAGAAIDYLIMALTPTLTILIVGRLIAGITGANMAVAGATVADISQEGERAKYFGWISGAFGTGFILGPILGGVLSAWFLRAPFLVAAGLNALNLILVVTLLRETRPGKGAAMTLAALNPLAPLKWALSFPALTAPILLFLVLALNGDIPGSIWVLYGAEAFTWNPVTVGVSLAGFGLCHALVQAFVTGPLTARIGERRTIVVGVVADFFAFVGMGFATQGWMAFSLMPLFALGSVSIPALQAIMSKAAGEERQGALQGVLASAQSLTAIAGPLIATVVYAWTKPLLIGAVWFLVAAIYVVASPLWAGFGRRAAR